MQSTFNLGKSKLHGEVEKRSSICVILTIICALNFVLFAMPEYISLKSFLSPA